MLLSGTSLIIVSLMTHKINSQPIMILLIDDDDITNFIHTKMLYRMDCKKEIIIKTDGLEALIWLNALKSDEHKYPDHIFLDLNMPVMNGIEFLNQVRKFHPVLIPRISIMTSIVLTSHIMAVRKIGIAGIYQKPLVKKGFEDILKKNNKEFQLNECVKIE